jgi:hypothetical protein
MRTVHVLPSRGSVSLHQSFYLDRATMALLPNLTFLKEDGEFLFETNSLGLRGPEPSSGRRFAVVWGDSVVFSSPFHRSWPEQIADASIDCLVLNGGVEGSSYQQILARAVALNRKTPAALNVILLGWHHFPDNRHLRGDLENALGEVPNPVLVTQPTSLNARIAGEDLSAYFVDSVTDPRFFRFWGATPYSVPLQQAYFAHICERNAVIREVARERAVPLVDLFALLDSTRLEDFRTYFFDIGHPRPNAYPVLASLLRDALSRFLGSRNPLQA